jgi:hypothetical protein
MTQSPVFISGSSTTMIDFTTTALGGHGTAPLKVVGNRRVMWAGNVVPDGHLRYTGMSNDRDAVLQAVGGIVPSNILNGYHSADVTMDGVVKYTGTGNDRDVILQNIGGTIPTSTLPQQLP